MIAKSPDEECHHAWNPGLQSDIPKSLWPAVTLFCEENATISYHEAKELSDLTGLKILDLYALRPERLVVHALLVRVTADLSVPDGPKYEDLGINLRGMVDTIYKKYMRPEMSQITGVYTAEKDKVATFVAQQLSEQIFDRTPARKEAPQRPSVMQRWFRWSKKTDEKKATIKSPEPVELAAVAFWKKSAATSKEPLHSACFKALASTVDAITGQRGRLIKDPSLIQKIIVNQVGNSHVADVVDRYIQPLWENAVDMEHYRRLPVQSKPVALNVKGASASGKSTIRPQQRLLAEKLGIAWEDFALISTDYWRKYMLDYDSLGVDHKYGAMLTGNELEVIDRQLDRYMSDKGRKGIMPHLLIDRFRFDSFVVDGDSRLLSRFGHRVYLFFMVTHPNETIVRAWGRGKTTGRYKAVDDLLYHNVEAYKGMPSLFMSWVNTKDRHVHYEFLDNDVVLGDLPRTAAFGSNESLTILDVTTFINIDRYRKVNIAARNADEIFSTQVLEASANTDFIVACSKNIPEIFFADQESAFVYANVRDGVLVWWDQNYIQGHTHVDGLTEAFEVLGYTGKACSDQNPGPQPIDVDGQSRTTVGRWSQG